MKGMQPAREIIERLAGRVDLIVMAAIGKREQLVEPSRQPGRLLWNVHLTRLEARRLREEARLLVEARRAQNWPDRARPAQVLGDRATDVGILDDGLIGTPLLGEPHHLAPKLGDFEPLADQIEEI